jgi:hypothetical protein
MFSFRHRFTTTIPRHYLLSFPTRVSMRATSSTRHGFRVWADAVSCFKSRETKLSAVVRVLQKQRSLNRMFALWRAFLFWSFKVGEGGGVGMANTSTSMAPGTSSRGAAAAAGGVIDAERWKIDKFCMEVSTELTKANQAIFDLEAKATTHVAVSTSGKHPMRSRETILAQQRALLRRVCSAYEELHCQTMIIHQQCRDYFEHGDMQQGILLLEMLQHPNSLGGNTPDNAHLGRESLHPKAFSSCLLQLEKDVQSCVEMGLSVFTDGTQFDYAQQLMTEMLKENELMKCTIARLSGICKSFGFLLVKHGNGVVLTAPSISGSVSPPAMLGNGTMPLTPSNTDRLIKLLLDSSGPQLSRQRDERAATNPTQQQQQQLYPQPLQQSSIPASSSGAVPLRPPQQDPLQHQHQEDGWGGLQGAGMESVLTPHQVLSLSDLGSINPTPPAPQYASSANIYGKQQMQPPPQHVLPQNAGAILHMPPTPPPNQDIKSSVLIGAPSFAHQRQSPMPESYYPPYFEPNLIPKMEKYVPMHQEQMQLHANNNPRRNSMPETPVHATAPGSHAYGTGTTPSLTSLAEPVQQIDYTEISVQDLKGLLMERQNRQIQPLVDSSPSSHVSLAARLAASPSSQISLQADNTHLLGNTSREGGDCSPGPGHVSYQDHSLRDRGLWRQQEGQLYQSPPAPTQSSQASKPSPPLPHGELRIESGIDSERLAHSVSLSRPQSLEVCETSHSQPLLQTVALEYQQPNTSPDMVAESQQTGVSPSQPAPSPSVGRENSPSIRLLRQRGTPAAKREGNVRLRRDNNVFDTPSTPDLLKPMEDRVERELQRSRREVASPNPTSILLAHRQSEYLHLLNQRVTVKSKNKARYSPRHSDGNGDLGLVHGTLRFVGNTHFNNSTFWLGIELDAPEVRNCVPSTNCLFMMASVSSPR